MSKVQESPKAKTPARLVEVHGQKLNTTSLIIADNCGVKHEATIKLVRKFLNDLSDVGYVRFEIRHNTQGSPTEIAILDDYAAMLLLTHMRSNDVVRKFKLELVREFKRITRILNEPGRKEELQAKCRAAKDMTDTLEFVRETMGKRTKNVHFMSEHFFCNRALTGIWGPITESELDVYDTRLLLAIRKRNTLLITRYPKQEDRKKPLADFVADYRIKNPRPVLVAVNGERV